MPTVESLQKASRQLLADWAKAQHAGDSKSYLALYDGKHFKGTKRTISGDKKVYDFGAWSADRTRMLKSNPEVAVENLTIDSWIDHRKMKPGLVHVRFLQRWRSPRYADHGPKIMQLFYGSDGKLHIIYEALLQSRPGWDKTTTSSQSMPVPRTDEEAEAVWRKMALTGKNLDDKLDAIADEPKLRRALARAVLKTNLDCKKLENEGFCGEDDYRWAPLPENASYDDPCLRLRVARWTLNSSILEPSDVRALESQLLNVFAFPQPRGRESGNGEGDELCEAVLDATEHVPAVYAQAVSAAITNHCAEKQAVKAVATLPEKTRVILAGEGIEAAFADLPVKTHADLFLTAVEGGGSTEHRVTAMKKLAAAGLGAELQKRLKTTLATVADDLKQPTEVAANAAFVLDKLGDPSHLPGRPAGGDAGVFEEQLRRLSFDPDKDRAKKRLRAFMPKKGRLIHHDVTETEYDGNTAVEDRDERLESTDKVGYADFGFDDLEYFLRPADGHTTTLTWDMIGGSLYLVRYETLLRSFVGCPC